MSERTPRPAISPSDTNLEDRLLVESIAVTVYLISVLKVDIRHERQSSPGPNEGY